MRCHAVNDRNRLHGDGQGSGFIELNRRKDIGWGQRRVLRGGQEKGGWESEVVYDVPAKIDPSLVESPLIRRRHVGSNRDYVVTREEGAAAAATNSDKSDYNDRDNEDVWAGAKEPHPRRHHRNQRNNNNNNRKLKTTHLHYANFTSPQNIRMSSHESSRRQRAKVLGKSKSLHRPVYYDDDGVLLVRPKQMFVANLVSSNGAGELFIRDGQSGSASNDHEFYMSEDEYLMLDTDGQRATTFSWTETTPSTDSQATLAVNGGESQGLAYLREAFEHWPTRHECVLEGDLILGGLMMVHEREDSVTCGPIMPQGGVQALEAMLYTLDRVNEMKLLPEFSLGAHILDDCDKDTYGLEMAVDFIKGTLSGRPGGSV